MVRPLLGEVGFADEQADLLRVVLVVPRHPEAYPGLFFQATSIRLAAAALVDEDQGTELVSGGDSHEGIEESFDVFRLTEIFRAGVGQRVDDEEFGIGSCSQMSLKTSIIKGLCKSRILIPVSSSGSLGQIAASSGTPHRFSSLSISAWLLS